MNAKKTKPWKEWSPTKSRNKYLKSMVANSTWIPTMAVLVLYASSGLLVIIGIFKLYKIIADIVMSTDILKSIDVIQILAQFIGIIEVYLLAIIFKIFAVGIFTLNVEEINEYRGERVDSIEELKCELAKAIVLFLAVFLLQKVVLWDDGLQTLYYGIIITLISAILIVFTIVLQSNITNKRNGHIFMTKHDESKDAVISTLKKENGELKKANEKKPKKKSPRAKK